jgi:hypothetical protein
VDREQTVGRDPSFEDIALAVDRSRRRRSSWRVCQSTVPTNDCAKISAGLSSKQPCVGDRVLMTARRTFGRNCFFRRGWEQKANFTPAAASRAGFPPSQCIRDSAKR